MLVVPMLVDTPVAVPTLLLLVTLLPIIAVNPPHSLTFCPIQITSQLLDGVLQAICIVDVSILVLNVERLPAIPLNP